MPVDRNGQRTIQRALGELATCLPYVWQRQAPARVPGWYAKLHGKPLDGCTCLRCQRLRAGKRAIYLGFDRHDAIAAARELAGEHALAQEALPA